MQAMGLKEKVMLMVQLLLLLFVVSTSPKSGVTAELEDTIHALREENSYLQERLESLTVALRELRKLLWDHSKGEFHPERGVTEPSGWYRSCSIERWCLYEIPLPICNFQQQLSVSDRIHG